MDTPRTLYKITPTSQGTEAAAEAAAALAGASIVFSHVDANYSTTLLQRSISVRTTFSLFLLCGQLRLV